MTMEEIKKGLTINDRYTLKEYVGNGSFGEVWRAYDKQEKKDVAIKIYISLNRKGCDEFLSEYQLASGLKHENLVVTEDYGVWNNRPFIIMEYCPNGSAANLVGKLTPCEEDERKIWTFIRDVSAGLAYLHQIKPDPIVHQDIKPDNIMIDHEGNFKIADFGISTKIRNTMSTQSKRVNPGSPAFMAPERFSKKPDPILASDIWSLGASIYELAEGKLPFSGMGGVMLKNGADMAELNPGWSQDLNAIMQSCLARDAWNRPRAKELNDFAGKVMCDDDDDDDDDDNPDPNPDPIPNRFIKILFSISKFLLLVCVFVLIGMLIDYIIPGSLDFLGHHKPILYVVIGGIILWLKENDWL